MTFADKHNTPEAMDAFWSEADDGYFEDRRWMYTFVAEYLAYHLHPNPQPSVCDFGCGCGHLLFMLRRLMPLSALYGVDYSVTGLLKTIQRDGSVLTLEADLTDLSGMPRFMFDGAVCVQTLEHITEAGVALAEMLRTMKPGGLLVLTVPNDDNWGGHHNHWTVGSFRELLETYGEVAEVFTFGRNEGDATNILARVVKV